jgi:hypothetical protein
MRAVLVLLAIGIATEAAADGFAWQAPASCPAAADVLARIEHRLDRDTRVRDIEVTVVKARAGFTATIDTHTAPSRTLNAASCTDLADAVAVIVARLATEAQRAALDAEPPPPPEVVGFIAPPRRERPLEVGAILVAPSAQPRWTGGLRLMAVSGIGVTPKVGYGGELSGYLQRGSRYGEIGYARWAERPTSNAPAHLDIGVSLLAMRGGWASSKMPLRAWGGVEIGAMHGIPTGIQMTPSSAIPSAEGSSGRWIAATTGFGVSWPMTRSARLVGMFEIAVPVATADFRFADGSPIYEPDPVSARCALGLEVAWR